MRYEQVIRITQRNKRRFKETREQKFERRREGRFSLERARAMPCYEKNLP
jgi:hypothetical protein